MTTVIKDNLFKDIELVYNVNMQCNFFSYKNIQLYNASCLDKNILDKESVDLIITSPPYNVGIDYNSNEDSNEYKEYLEFSRQWMHNCYIWAKDTARFCLNIPLDKNKGGQQSVGADLISIAKNIGWKYHSSIVWNEGNISRRTAWGSWLSASAPYVIAPVELIVVLYKNEWKKKIKGESDIIKEEFMAWTNGLWSFNGESKKRIGHPAPFPRELPKRCIKLFSFVGDIICDPFSGSGTTMIEAHLNNRDFIGIELDKEYCNLSIERFYKTIQKENGDILMNKNSQLDLIMEFFKKNPNRDISHPEVVDWVVKEWNKRTGKVFRDPDRGIRSLHQKGYLQKISKGVYRYDPDFVFLRDDLEDFTPQLKKQILERDNYKCVICGMGKNEGVELHVDHIKPKDLGGKATLENGQTLCSKHNFLKKNLKQTETGKKMFIRMLEIAKKSNERDLIKFLEEVLSVYEKYDINGHIIWKKDK